MKNEEISAFISNLVQPVLLSPADAQFLLNCMSFVRDHSPVDDAAWHANLYALARKLTPIANLPHLAGRNVDEATEAPGREERARKYGRMLEDEPFNEY